MLIFVDRPALKRYKAAAAVAVVRCGSIKTVNS
jgi:hypothetical protein